MGLQRPCPVGPAIWRSPARSLPASSGNDGRENGYSTEGYKTQHPWGEGRFTAGWEGDASAPYREWQSVRDGPFGREAVTTLRGVGVDVSRARTDPRRYTALMVKELWAGQDPHVYYYRHGSAGASFDVDDVAASVVAHVRRVHLAGITVSLGTRPWAAVHRLLEFSKEQGALVSLWAAGHVVGQRGDWEGLPYRADNQRWRETRPTIRR